MSDQASLPSGGVNMPLALRRFYWSVRREIWEHRALYRAPLGVAGVVLVGFVLGLHRLAGDLRAVAAGSRRAGSISVPYDFVCFAVIMAGLAFAIVYCLDCLQAERRDRSILFWKSLPVSDLTTVLAKAAVPILVLPLVLFAIALGAQGVMAALSALAIIASKVDLGLWWRFTPLPGLWLDMAEHLAFTFLWYAPIFAWLILVSAWARRVAYLWALLPPLGLALVERLALGTDQVWIWLRGLILGPYAHAAAQMESGKGNALQAHPPDTPGWASLHLWLGLALTAAFLVLAARLRRGREPN